jgi:hypothetical protein
MDSPTESLIPKDANISWWSNPDVLKKGTYGALVSLVAGAVIFGALIIIAEHGHIPMGEGMDRIIDGLGKYDIVPLATSSTLLLALIAFGVIWKRLDKTSDSSKIVSKEPVTETPTPPSKAESDGSKNVSEQPTEKQLTKTPIQIPPSKPAQPKRGQTTLAPIHAAVLLDNVKDSKAQINKIVNEQPAWVHATTRPDFFTGLHLAVTEKEGALEKTKHIFSLANSIKRDINGNTPLMYMVSQRIEGFTPDINVFELLSSEEKPDNRNRAGKLFEDLARANYPDWVEVHKETLIKHGFIKKS